MTDLDLSTVNRYLLAKQHLAPGYSGGDAVQVARDVGGLHATAATTPYLSLLARLASFAKTDLERALWEERTLAKQRCVRGTVYVQPVDLLPLFHVATLALRTRDGERYLALRGISASDLARLSEGIVEQLAGRAMTAAELKRALGTQADVSAVLSTLTDRGVLVRARPSGGWRDSGHSYALWAERFPDVDLGSLDVSEATRRLLVHYLGAFGPATESDIIWWTGLSARTIRAALDALGHVVDRVSVAGLEGEHLMLRCELETLRSLPPTAPQGVALLPVLDPYPMGYKRRARYLDALNTEYVFDRSGNVTSTILVDGRVVGVWDGGQKGEAMIKYLVFEPVESAMRGEIEAQAARLGAFIHERPVDVAECASMTALMQRTAGGMMSPLRDCPPVTGALTPRPPIE